MADSILRKLRFVEFLELTAMALIAMQVQAKLIRMHNGN